MSKQITLALPSKGAIAEPTYEFLRSCDLKVHKPNPRQYVGTLRSLPEVGVLFQRVKDILYKVADGTAEIGVTGYDVVYEAQSENIIVIHDQLGYGHCKLVIAVPEAWVDVQSMADLAEVALDFREKKGRDIRIATTYENSARNFLHKHGIHHFSLVRAEGAIEAAPTIGYADLVVDITQTGTTLRENHLRILRDGEIIKSQACLIGNIPALKSNPVLMDTVRKITELIDASLNAKQFYQLAINIQGDSASEVAEKVSSNPLTAGLLGPTIAPVYHMNGEDVQDAGWYSVTISISNNNLLPAIDHLREIGGVHATAVPVRYMFEKESDTFAKLVANLESR